MSNRKNSLSDPICRLSLDHSDIAALGFSVHRIKSRRHSMIRAGNGGSVRLVKNSAIQNLLKPHKP